MTQRNDKDTTGRTVAIVGGGALLLWLFLRGGGSGGGTGHAADSTTATVPPAAPQPPCKVRIDSDGIELEGARTDLATMTARCKLVGAAEVRATGDAITGVIAEVVQSLRAAGVQVTAASDIWNTADLPRRSR